MYAILGFLIGILIYIIIYYHAETHDIDIKPFTFGVATGFFIYLIIEVISILFS